MAGHRHTNRRTQSGVAVAPVVVSTLAARHGLPLLRAMPPVPQESGRGHDTGKGLCSGSGECAGGGVSAGTAGTLSGVWLWYNGSMDMGGGA